jgi:P4 family phage/plasmid primase-like protien
MKTANPVLLAAIGYVAEQYRVVPIPPAKKGPIIAGWQNLRLTAGDMELYFETACNIGIQTCEGLVDIDLDSPEARALAPHFLPPTDRICGRPGSPNSHWFYRCDPTPEPARFADPTKTVDGRAMLVELRSTGQQTMVPPSLHPSGEHVAWTKEGQPAIEHGGVLHQYVGKLAAAALIARHWNDTGSRHELAMAVAGALAHAGWEEEDATRFIEVVADAAGDEELGDRLKAVGSTFEGFGDGKEVTGIPTLADLLEKRVVAAFVSWLSLRDHSILRELETSVPKAQPAPDGCIPLAHPPTDLGNGERFNDQHRHEARYSYRRSTWFSWVGTHWQQDQMGGVQRMASRTVRSILSEAAQEPDPARRKSLAVWAKSSESQGRRDAMLKSAAEHLAVDDTQFDADPWLLNCLNGTVDLRTGALQSSDPSLLLSKCAHVAYDVAACCPTWLDFLWQVMRGRQPLVDFLQRALGYSLTGRVSEDALFFLYGTGGNGKSTFVRTVRSILGDYGAQAAPDLLLAKVGQQHPTELAALFGKRFVASVEPDARKKLDEGVVKHLTGGDAITARRMYEDFWEFHPTHKLWLSANHKPTIKGTDTGIWRRIKLVPFDVAIAPEDQDKALDIKLQGELAGILAWMVEGCLAWQRDGLTEPEEVRVATGAYREEMDVLAGFIEECCDVQRSHYCTAAELYAAYVAWCTESGERPETQRAFGLRMEERGFDRYKGTGGSRRYRGIRPISEDGVLTQAEIVAQVADSGPVSNKIPDLQNASRGLKQKTPLSATCATLALEPPSAVGVLVNLLGLDGALQTETPWRIVRVDTGPDEQARAYFSEDEDGWPLAQCERVTTPSANE